MDPNRPASPRIDSAPADGEPPLPRSPIDGPDPEEALVDPGLDVSDGLLYREESRPEAYVLYGGAKFRIASPEELFALGFTWANVKVVPTGRLSAVPVVPRTGTLLRERSQPEVYLIVDTSKVWVPTPDALFAIGADWSRVRVVPNGALVNLPRIALESAAPTPPSLVFPPGGTRWSALTGLPGTTRVVSQGREVRIVELRGWLREASEGCNPVDPDWHWALELDPSWLDRLGLDPNQILKVGNILQRGAEGPTDATCLRMATVPYIWPELAGWPNIADVWRNARLPADWQGPWNEEATCVNSEQRRVFWPFDPRYSHAAAVPGAPPLERRRGTKLVAGRDGQPADYVRMVGSLISDNPHYSGWTKLTEAKKAWGDPLSPEEPAHAARWTEIHSPDLIEVLPSPGPQRERYWGVAVAARNLRMSAGLPLGETQAREVTFQPPGPRPRKSRAAVVEMVGPETILASIVEGNATRTGANIAVFEDRVQVRVAVQSEGGWGRLGRFKAIYRVSWVEDPTVPDDMGVRIEPYPVPFGVSVQVVVRAENAWTQGPVDGQVLLNGKAVGRTNVAFTYTFRTIRRRVRDPETGGWTYVDVPPTATVSAPGYRTAALDLGTAAEDLGQ